MFPISKVARLAINGRAKSRRKFQTAVAGKAGLEIGGPSAVFGDFGELPLYRYVSSLDNCVYSEETIWEGQRSEGKTFQYHAGKPNGQNFICEATNLSSISDSSYDFLLSSHNLEHISNPIKALKEWIRVVRRNAPIIILLPDYRRTFDHNRRPTPVSHMLEDFILEKNETDLTHLDEILALHDLSRDRAAGGWVQFKERSLRNPENRCLHHHVFDENNSVELLGVVGLSVLAAEVSKPFHIIILAECR